MDLPGRPEIPADLEWVQPSARCTLLAKQKASVQMVEHLLSAFAGLGVDNARVEVNGPEIPVGDGSASEPVRKIEEAGIVELKAARKRIAIAEPIYWSQEDIHLVALPSPDFRISYTLHYPQSPLIRSQYFSFDFSAPRYKFDLAPSRTFCLYEEIAPMVEKGLLRGGGLDQALVIQGEKILNPEGARFSDEMVRHKVLDLIGDLSLLGAPILGHIVAIRSGHASNVAFAAKIREQTQTASRRTRAKRRSVA